jgi:PleD family two-component response regulator
LPDQKSKSAVTVSIGVACLAGNERISPKALIKNADDALFVSKRGGKNLVSLSPADL